MLFEQPDGKDKSQKQSECDVDHRPDYGDRETVGKPPVTKDVAEIVEAGKGSIAIDVVEEGIKEGAAEGGEPCKEQ